MLPFCSHNFFKEAQSPSKQPSMHLVASHILKIVAMIAGGENMYPFFEVDICLLYGGRMQVAWSCPSSPAALGSGPSSTRSTCPFVLGISLPDLAPEGLGVTAWISLLTEVCLGSPLGGGFLGTYCSESGHGNTTDNIDVTQ